MKKQIILIHILILISIAAYSQVALIENYRNNVVYVGLDNPFKATIISEDCQSFFLTATNGTLKGDNCSYMFRPNKPGNAFIVFNKIINEDTVVIEEKEFRVKNLPAPTARVCGITNGEISKQNLIVQLGVITELDNFDIDIRIKAKRYRTIILRGDKIIFNNVNEGNRFTDITKEGLQNVQMGDIVYFVSIIAVYPDETEIPTNSIELKII